MSTHEDEVLSHLKRIATAVENIQLLLAHALDPTTLQDGERTYHTAEGDPDYLAAIAAEVEGRIQDSSTPRIGRDVDLDEGAEYEVREGIHVNLLEQPRDTIGSLQEKAPEDPFIKLAIESANPVAIAALEIVYSNVPVDLWGSATTQKQISSLIAMHEQGPA